MVKITNGKDVFEVTRGAFDGIYSRQGFKIVGEDKPAKNNSNGGNNDLPPELTEDEKFLAEIVEKPISQWSKEEIKRFASLKEIDITGTKNANEAKELIKEFLENDEDSE